MLPQNKAVLIVKIVAKVLRYLTVSVAVLVVVGAVYQWRTAAVDRAAYPAPGEVFSIDGLAMHLDCRGEGEPVVVLEAGLMSGSASWGLVHDRLSEVTRICAYDRAGIDWSEVSDGPMDATIVTSRLHELLSVAGIDEPQILVGMSAGGVFVREYYARFPQQVTGMVLVDSSHEQQGERLPAIGDSARMDSMLSLCSWLQPVGIVRAFSLLDPLLSQFSLPGRMADLSRANAYQSHTCAAMRKEMQGFQREIFDTSAPVSLGDLPLTVISQGKALENAEQFGITLAEVEKMAASWDVLQNELTALSSQGRRLIATESGHVIQLEQPQIVIDAVGDMVRQVRNTAVSTAME